MSPDITPDAQPGKPCLTRQEALVVHCVTNRRPTETNRYPTLGHCVTKNDASGVQSSTSTALHPLGGVGAGPPPTRRDSREGAVVRGACKFRGFCQQNYWPISASAGHEPLPFLG